VNEFRRKLTPPALAKRFGVKPSTVLRWIRDGELRAVDVSRQPGVGRPRFRIDEADVVAFENRRMPIHRDRRQSARRRKKRDSDVVEFF